MTATAHMTGMRITASARSRRPSRLTGGRWLGSVDVATDLRLARQRLAISSWLSEQASAKADRAEFELVKALRDRRAGAERVKAARRRPVDAQDAARDAFHLAEDAARAVIVLTRSIGGLSREELNFSDLLADLGPPL